MATRPMREVPATSESIPFYRNVKIIGILAQIIFVLIVFVGIFILYRNVSTALSRSNLPANFNFLGNRAGIPIAETPIRYTTNDPYWRAMVVGFLNTLRIALVGVVLASLLGVLVGVMRLSSNWLLRQLASGYVELIRNTPLAVQIVFWFTAVLVPLPPRINNPVELPGGIYFSNLGFAMPWLFPTYRFPAWAPWLLGALVLFVLLFIVRRRQIIAADRPGNAWLLPLLSALLVAGVGYYVVADGSALPEGTTTNFRADQGRGTVFIDSNNNGVFDRNEAIVPYARVIIGIPEGQMSTTTQNLSESRGFARGTFRFPVLKEHEYESAEVRFADPEAAAGLSIHTLNVPSIGLVYRDLNGNGRFDAGEEINPATGNGYSGVALIMEVVGFERTMVADREGQVRIPRFEVAQEAALEAAPAVSSPASIFASPARQPQAAVQEATLEQTIRLEPTGPLVLSTPSIPVTTYVGGISLTASYLAMLLALVVYTAAFIAEIVRGGIQAVHRGQGEAAKALGLSPYQTFSLIIFPQALRIILPPMISQYLNLTKNSSLAPLAAYAELFAISIIVANQTGASIPVIIIIIVSYLFISLTFATVLNWVNARFALVER